MARSRSNRASAIRRLLCSLVTTLVILQCQADTVDVPTHVQLGRPAVVTDAEPLIVLGSRWGLYQCADQRLGFRERADVLIWHRQSPKARTLDVHFSIGSDSEVRSLATATSGTEGAGASLVTQDGRSTLRVSVPAGTGGLTRVTLLGQTPAGEPARGTVCLDEIGVALPEGRELELRPDDYHRDRFVGLYLDSATTGLRDERYAGWLFVGESRAELELPGAAESPRFGAVIQNGSRGEATFSVTGSGLEQRFVLPPGGSQRIEVVVPAGTTRLELGVESADPSPSAGYLWGAPSIASESTASDRPNVVLISLDTFRKDNLEVYGGPSGLTPEISSFANDSTVFTEAFAVAPWTLPTHASMFTGLYPGRHRVGLELPRFAAEQQPLASRLAEAGYRTIGIAGGELASSRWGMSRGFDEYYDPPFGGEIGGDRIVELVEDQLGRLRQPFFLFVNVFDTHMPYEAPSELLDEVQRRLPPLDGPLAIDDVQPPLGERLISAEEGEVYRRLYLAEVAFVDHVIGRIVQLLRDAKALEDSLVVLTGDHGELLGEAGMLGHNYRLHPKLLEIPLIVRWPGQSSGRVDDRLVSQVDLFPTILDVATGQPARPGDGLDLRGDERHEAVFAQEHESWLHPLDPTLRVATDLYAAIRPDQLDRSWRDGSSCLEREGREWRAADCLPPDRGGSTFEGLVSAAGDEVDPLATSLTDEQRSGLEALGYIQPEPPD